MTEPMEIQKTCNKCGGEKHLRPRSNGRVRSYCAACKLSYNRQYYSENRQDILDQKKSYYSDHGEKIRQKRAKYVSANRDEIIKKLREYYKKHKPTFIRRNNEKKILLRATDPGFRLYEAISKGVAYSLRTGKGGRRTFKLLGYSLEDLMEHLEARFRDGMTWSNYGTWHVDHIRPIASFKINNVDDEDFKKCWSLNNLQPLWAADNIRKGAKYETGTQDATE